MCQDLPPRRPGKRDACLSGPDPAALVRCVKLTAVCADICAATARVLSRRGDPAGIASELLALCEKACRACAEECEKHAGHHEHCAVCAEACSSCEDACQQLRRHLG
ncbi:MULTISPECIES: four-helix bundle copper-binding protein [Amycolatopsis]|uniref:four-helix bundle copper-binding protein n=1 Tax=Amycolatopsis TaxID=1813 RepID=UPI001E655485|nr:MULTISPECIES: four-helix bundle copper-binding protein [Amycolatopsis]